VPWAKVQFMLLDLEDFRRVPSPCPPCSLCTVPAFLEMWPPWDGTLDC
jgi:hypothetical protein